MIGILKLNGFKIPDANEEFDELGFKQDTLVFVGVSPVDVDGLLSLGEATTHPALVCVGSALGTLVGCVSQSLALLLNNSTAFKARAFLSRPRRLKLGLDAQFSFSQSSFPQPSVSW